MIKRFLFLAFFYAILACTIQAQTFCIGFSVVSKTSTDIVLALSLTSTSPFTLGDGDFFIKYNTLGLSDPVMVSNSITSAYNPSFTKFLSTPSQSVAAFGWNYASSTVEGLGIPISATPTDIVHIKFTIIDNTKTSGFTVYSASDIFKDDVIAGPTQVLLTTSPPCPGLDFSLPLSWLSFQAQRTTENAVQLDWVTASEVNVKNFVVQRSVDGTNFIAVSEPIAAHNLKAQNNYQSFDNQPLNGLSYYRIVETDIDGVTSYSKVVSVNLGTAANSIRLFPNPAKENVTVQISGNNNSNATLTLYDALGRIVRIQNLGFIGALANTTFSVSDLAAGVYTAQIVSDSSQWQEKLVIEK